MLEGALYDREERGRGREGAEPQRGSLSLGRQGRKDSRNKMASKEEEGIAKQTKEKNKKKASTNQVVPVRSFLLSLDPEKSPEVQVVFVELESRSSLRREARAGRKAGRRRRTKRRARRKTKHKIKDRSKSNKKKATSLVFCLRKRRDASQSVWCDKGDDYKGEKGGPRPSLSTLSADAQGHNGRDMAHPHQRQVHRRDVHLVPQRRDFWTQGHPFPRVSPSPS